jgi:hypothetical protein
MATIINDAEQRILLLLGELSGTAFQLTANGYWVVRLISHAHITAVFLRVQSCLHSARNRIDVSY